MMFSANKGKSTQKTTAERLSSRVLYVLAALTAVIFGCFYTIGYDIPYNDDPQFKSPMFTDAVLVFALLLVIAALAATAYATVRAVRTYGRDTAADNNIPSRRIAATTAAATSTFMAVAFIAGSAHPMFVNGTQYTTTLWLKASDMFITTIITLISVAIITVIAGRIRYGNRIKKDRRQ